MKPFTWRELTCLLLALVRLSCPLAAQIQPDEGWSYRFEVFAEVAHGSFYHGDSNWGKGLDLGGGIGIRPFSGGLQGLGFELRAARLSSDAAAAAGSSTLASRLVTIDAVLHFRSDSRVQPYMLGGLGFIRARYTRDCSGCVFNLDPVTQQLTPIPFRSEAHGAKAGLTMGGGLKIAVHPHISLRPEILLVTTTPGEGWNWGWLRAQIGVGCHF